VDLQMPRHGMAINQSRLEIKGVRNQADKINAI
jgi:hypothetical protein